MCPLLVEFQMFCVLLDFLLYFLGDSTWQSSDDYNLLLFCYISNDKWFSFWNFYSQKLLFYIYT